MNERLGRAETLETRLQAELSGWLRDFETAALPINARLRISADLRAEAARPTRLWPRLPRLVSTAASLVVVLAWAVLFLLVVTSTGTESYGPGSPDGPTPVVNPPGPGLGSSPLLADPLWLALILVVSALAGGGANLRLVRSAVGRVVFGSGKAVPAPPVPLRRRLRTVPRLAFVLAMLPIINVVMQPYLHHPLMVSYSVSLFLPSALACVVAFRYPARDRSVRWLLVGGVALGLAVAMHLDTYWTLRAIGWMALAIGLAARAGVASRPRWFLVAAAVGVVLYVEANSVINIAANYHPVDYVLPSLVYQAATECLISFAWMAIFWTAFTCLRRGGGPAWVLVLAAASGLFGLHLYRALDWNVGLTLWLTTWLDYGIVANALLAVEWLSFGALLTALLIGLRPASDGTQQPDSGAEPGYVDDLIQPPGRHGRAEAGSARPTEAAGSSEPFGNWRSTAPRARRSLLRRLPRR
jgi:hypothetical protein